MHIRVGYIFNTLGIKGELKVEPLTNDIKRFDDLEYCYINMGKFREKVYIQSYRPYKNGNIIVKLKDYDDINSVLKFKGRYMEIGEENLAQLEEGHYYIFQIIGCRVFTTDGEELGSVVEVLQPGGNDVYVVEGDKGQVLIPAIKEVVKEIDVDNKIIKVVLLEGLIEE